MKKQLQNLILLAFIGLSLNVNSQNWQYVGAPYINQSVGYYTSLYFQDLEFNAAGDAFVGYWEYSQVCHFAKFSSGTWTQLPSPGTFPVNAVDIEVKGNNYYYAYSGVRGSNSYVFVRKYNGTSWTQLGDSLLLGNSGSGGYFDFLLDNNEVPTILGVVAASMANKQIMQFNGTNWTSLVTLQNSAATIFQDNSGIFDSQNKLYCLSQSGVSTPPTVHYYNIVNKIDAGVRTTVGDTIPKHAGRNIIKLNASDNPYICFNETLLSKVMAYKLNGSTWSFIADTTGTMNTMVAADLTSDGKIIFGTLASNTHKSVFMYDNGTRSNLDTINNQGTIANIVDIVIPNGSNDVYILIPNSGTSNDISVLKHSLTGTTGIDEVISENESVNIYPNPANTKVIITLSEITGNTNLTIVNVLGETVCNQTITSKTTTINIEDFSKGIYTVVVNANGNKVFKKLVVD